MLDYAYIKSVLPHRYPFLMIDKIESILNNKEIIGLKNVSWNDNFFLGHFPDDPVMPGVLIIESMAQTAAVLVKNQYPDTGNSVYFRSIDSSKFIKLVRPGDVLKLHVKLINHRNNLWKFDGIALVDGIAVASASFSAFSS